MKISAKIDYACKALLELSLHWPNTSPLQINTIAKRQNIPVKFLTHILINLKQLGLVQSVRGKLGGYRLIKEPKAIKLSELVGNFDGTISQALQGQNNPSQRHVLSSVWREIDAVVLKAMDNINFETICNRKRSKDNVVMFEI